jgi:DmsE family decaheme c-type cytochrome
MLLFAFISIQASDYSKTKLIEETSLCLECHDGQAETLMNTPHHLLAEETEKVSLAVGCISCHPGWEDHLEEPSNETIGAGPELAGAIQAKTCASCHQTPHQVAMASTDPHLRQGYNCSSCHTVHGNRNRFLVKSDNDNFCTECHNSVALEFKRRSAHPLESGNIRCTDCHHLGSIEDPDLVADFDWTCQSCHYEVTGPFVYEHPVVYTHLVEGSGCTECHQPHGSANERLLKQAGDGTCRQCHMTPAGHRIAHSGLAARHDCIDCHSEIHGSDHNAMLLDPELGMKMPVDCYQCHDIRQ